MGNIEKTRGNGTSSACPACNHAADLKAKSEVLQRLMGPGALPAGYGPQDEPTPAQREAAAWHLAIDAGLQREMAPHPRCSLCGILMGQGHIEAGTADLCGTCDHRHTTAIPPASGAGQPLAGRRGWFSDHVARQNRS